MIDDIVSAYIRNFPTERGELAQLIEQIANEDVLNNRKSLPGHITAGAVILSPDRSKILLVHHKILDAWLQPGGHWDPGEPEPRTAAVREAIEETGVTIAKQLPIAGDDMTMPLDIDTHPIPANPSKHEPAHLHYDFRYVFVAANETLSAQKDEVNDAVFVAFDDPRTSRVQRIIEKLYRLGISYTSG